ncbi:SDR family NAD(P)-dependent oxidoreductase [Salinisphaera sp. RV14]|uniref:SDR family NAD(P)-dependent oxidoreductase n=1 Tax=unclassified Salinisphaera TaxID=2649847 RepID=UPI003F834443
MSDSVSKSGKAAGMAFVTGGSRGIGAAICRQLAADGYAVAVGYGHNEAAAQSVVAAIRDAGGTAEAVHVDVSELDSIDERIGEAEAALGRLSVLVANAGVTGETRRVDEQSLGNIEDVFRVNAVAPIVCAQAAVRRLSTRHGGQGGAIVIMSSVAAHSGGAGGLATYGASKGAMETFILGLGKEVADEGIRVTGVAPGIIDTDMPPDELREAAETAVPMRRLGKPAEIADAVSWLVSDRASFVTGESVTVSGGR